jgi:hypothetical protein
MADMNLPFKLLSQPSPDTSGAIAADTRKLASGEALQRLKTSGLMDVQRQKGMDTRYNTLLGHGINPTQQGLRSGTLGPEVANQLNTIFKNEQMLKQGQGYDAARGAGIGITHKNPFMLGGPIQQVAAGLPLKGEAQAHAASQAEARSGAKEKYWGTSPEERVGALSQYERSSERKSKLKGGAATQKLAANHIDYVTKNLGIPRDKIVGIVENPRVGNKEHQGTFVQYTDAKGKPRARRLSPQDITNMGAAQ